MPIATNHHQNMISGDAGGVACTIRSEDGNVFIVSLTHFRTEPDPHSSGRTLACQKQRMIIWQAKVNLIRCISSRSR